LRKALTEHVRSAMKEGRMERHGKRRDIDVDQVIKQYLLEGSTFDYVEKVLQSAGFDFDPRPSPESPSRFVGGAEEFDVNAYLGFGRELFEGGVQCVVALRPAAPYDYGLVHQILTDCGFFSL
jgi:hypothetical protein